MSAISLSAFIRTNREPILEEWEAFARTCTPAAHGMNSTALRNHAGRILAWIADDLETEQSDQQEDAKARGLADEENGESVASRHGQERYVDQFTLPQIFSEFRALRASVIRLWTNGREVADVDELRDLTRFNEAIDQLVAESVQRFSERLEEARDMFAAILGHDLRTPLGAIIMGASYLESTLAQQTEALATASRILNSGNRMGRLITDILDFSRVRLGGDIPIFPSEMAMDDVCREIVAEVLAGQPDKTVSIVVKGNVSGVWDRERVGQVISNLVSNALQHGIEGSPVVVSLTEADSEVLLAIHNWGPVIPDKDMARIFDLGQRLSVERQGADNTGSLGLGLHIVRLILSAHGGTVEVDSTLENGTTFTTHWPK